MNLLVEYKHKLKSLLRIKAENSLMYAISYINPTWYEPVHLKPIIEVLQDIIDGNVRRCLFSAPPQTGKSETIFHAIALYIKKNPKRKVIYISFSETEAVARVFKAYEYAKVLNVEMSNRWESKTEWRTTAGGGVFATGVKGGAVGRSADLIIIDDPYPNLDSVKSKAYNRTLLNYFIGTVKTRIRPTTSLIINATRWSPNDLLGQLSDKYESISIPAIIQKDGEEVSFCENLAPIETLKEIRQATPNFFEANYQQSPTEVAGSYFKNVTKFVDKIECEYISYAGDLAYTEGGGDYTVLAKVGKKDGKYYILDIKRFQKDITQTEKIIESFCEGHILLEDNGVQKGINNLIAKNSNIYVLRRKIQGSKVTRAINLIRYWNLGKVYMVKDSWNKEVIDEFLNFDGETGTDDIVDAITLAINDLKNI